MHRIQFFLDDLLARSTPSQPVWNQEALLENKPAAWSYIDGCMMIAVLYMYEATGEEQYFRFLQDFIDYYIDDDGVILGYDLEAMNSDSINEGKVLFALYEKTGNEKYRKAMDTLYQQVKMQPRTQSGNFWHKKIYPNQIWLDGLYMVQPFYVAYELLFNDGRKVSDSVQQFKNVQQFLQDEQTGLYFHGYDETREAFWADDVTGCSQNFWTRSIGWYAMALVDTIALLQGSYNNEAQQLSDVLNDLLESVLKYQNKSKLFYQVTNQGPKEGNYLETSGTCALAYTLMKGSRLGVLPLEAFNQGAEILQAVIEQKLVMKEAGWVLTDICLVAGLGGMAGKGTYKKRDGTYAYYISEPIVENDAKGIGPFIYAYTEFLKRH